MSEPTPLDAPPSSDALASPTLAAPLPPAIEAPPLAPELDALVAELLDGLPEAEFYHVPDLLALSKEAQFSLFKADPARFLLSFLDAFGTGLRQHIALLEAIRAHTALDADAEAFMPLILQTLKGMEAAGDIPSELSWAEALQKAKERVQSLLQASNSPQVLADASQRATPQGIASGKGGGTGEATRFSNKSIKAMSVAEFNRQKEAIFQAYREGRVDF